MGGIIWLLQYCRAWNRGKNCIIQSYTGHNAGGTECSAADRRRQRPRGRGCGAGGSPVCYILLEILDKKRLSIYLLLYISPAYSYILYIFPPFSLTPFPLVQLRVMVLPCFGFGCSPIYCTPLLPFFNPRKNKKRPLRFYPQEPFWRNCPSLFSQDC